MGPDEVGALVRKFRSQARLTQYELADMSTVSIRAIRDLENGRVERPRQETVRLIADGLNLGQSQRLVLHAACGGNVQDAAMKLIGNAAPIAPPAVMSGLSGRDAEVEAVVEAMTRDLNRWITITGLNGVGKTGVALGAAHALYTLHSYSVLWAAFGESGRHVESPDRFAVDSAVVAEVSRIGENLAGAGFDAHQLCEMIGQRRTLLVLDGCDLSHVTVERITALLAGCRGLRVLVTTRNSRSTPGDHLFPLEPLDVPVRDPGKQSGKLEHLPAVQLMLSHIRRLRPRAMNAAAMTEQLAGVCHALDCIPGALKLGAEWALVLSPDQLLKRANSDPLSLLLPPTDSVTGGGFRESLERTLRSVTARDRSLLRLLSAFRGSWTVAHAAQAAELDESDATRRICGLYIRGLIRRDQASAGNEFRVLNLVSHLFAAAAPVASPELADPVHPMPV